MCERIWACGQCNNGCLHGEHRKVKPIQTSTEHVKFPAERRPQKYQKSVPNALGTKLVSEIHIKQSFWTLVSTSCDLMLTQQPAQVLPEQCLDAFLLKNPRAIVGWNTQTHRHTQKQSVRPIYLQCLVLLKDIPVSARDAWGFLFTVTYQTI